MRSHALLFVATLVTATRDLAAQPRVGVGPGTAVRVTAPASGLQRWEATVESVRGDTLMLRPVVYWERAPLTVTGARIPLANVERLEVRRSVRGRLWKGFGIGALSGAALGAALVLAQGEDKKCELGCTNEAGAAGVVAVLGASVGGLVGLSIAHVTAEHWAPVPLEALRVEARAARRGPVLALRVTTQ